MGAHSINTLLAYSKRNTLHVFAAANMVDTSNLQLSTLDCERLHLVSTLALASDVLVAEDRSPEGTILGLGFAFDARMKVWERRVTNAALAVLNTGKPSLDAIHRRKSCSDIRGLPVRDVAS